MAMRWRWPPRTRAGNAAAPRAQAHLVGQALDALAASPWRAVGLQRGQAFVQDLGHAHARVQLANGSWKMICTVRRALAQRGALQLEQVAAVEQGLAFGLRLAAQQLHDGLAGGGLAAARLTHQRQRLAGATWKDTPPTASKCPSRAAACRLRMGKRTSQVLHLQQWPG
jgi:hypothetical protein